MPSPILQDIAKRIPELEARLEELTELITVAERAGEDTTGFTAEKTLLTSRLQNWKNALQQSGY